MLTESERIQLLLLTESELAIVNEERQTEWISLQGTHEPNSGGLEEERQIVYYYASILIDMSQKFRMLKNKPYSQYHITCTAVQLFKRYFLRWSIAACKNIQQIQLLCLFMALKLQNIHNSQIKEKIFSREKVLRRHPFENCVLLGDVNYADVEKTFIEKLRFNFNVDSLFKVVESLLSHIEAVNKDLKLEEEVASAAEKVLLDNSLIFEYDQQTLGLGCVIYVLDNKHISRDIYLPSEVCKLISSQSSVFVPLSSKLSHLRPANKEQLNHMVALFKAAQQNHASNSNNMHVFKKPERISRVSHETISHKVVSTIPTSQPSTHPNTSSSNNPENKLPIVSNTANSAISSIHAISNSQNNIAIPTNSNTNSQVKTRPLIQEPSDKLIAQEVNQTQLPSSSKYSLLTHAVCLNSDVSSNSSNNNNSSSSTIEIEQPIVSSHNNKPTLPPIVLSQSHNNNAHITPAKQSNSAHSAAPILTKSNANTQQQSDNIHPTNSNIVLPSTIALSPPPTTGTTTTAALISSQASSGKPKAQIIGASAFPTENPSKISQQSKSPAIVATVQPSSQQASPLKDQTKSPLRLTTPIKSSSTSTKSSSIPQQQPRDKSSKQQSSSSSSYSSRGERTPQGKEDRTPQGKEERSSSSRQQRSRTPSKRESSHSSSSQNHWKSNEKSRSKGGSTSARAPSPNVAQDEPMELEDNYLPSSFSLSQLISDGTTSESAAAALSSQQQSLNKNQIEIGDKIELEKELDQAKETGSSNVSPNKGSSSTRDIDERHRSERDDKGTYKSDRDDRSNRQKRDRDFERPKERKRTYESDKRDRHGDKDDRDSYSSSSSSYHRDRESSKDKKDRCKESRDREYDRDNNDRESRDYKDSRDSKDFKKDRDRDYKDKERDRDYKDRDKKDRYRDKQRDKSDSRDRETRDRKDNKTEWKDKEYKDTRERKDSRDFRDSKDFKEYKESRDKDSRNRSDQYSSSSTSSSAQKDKEESRRNSEKDKRNEVSSTSSEVETKRKDSQTIIEDTKTSKTAAEEDIKTSTAIAVEEAKPINN